MKNCSVAEVKDVLLKNEGIALQINHRGTDVFVLKPDYEIDKETYDEAGIWLCEIVCAVRGSHPKFHELFKPEGLIDIVENQIWSIKNENSEILYQKT